ncbi:hypothetical protein TNCV_1862791 [Trichonephila clavipes]|nr:hypothetical protein TNCV_1862791 [Trichonephila clavipes]
MHYSDLAPLLRADLFLYSLPGSLKLQTVKENYVHTEREKPNRRYKNKNSKLKKAKERNNITNGGKKYAPAPLGAHEARETKSSKRNFRAEGKILFAHAARIRFVL